MSRSNSPPTSGTPHLVSLVVHSKKALQHGELLCNKAHELQSSTSELASEVLALNARLCWVVQGVLDQLKLAGSVAKNIETRRNRLIEQAKQWDLSRTTHSTNLDGMLEILESQLVPPWFYEQQSESLLLFGDQHLAASDETKRLEDKSRDRSKWKTLRDFVAERDMEEASENIDNDRMALEDILAKTEEFPTLLFDSISLINETLPPNLPLPQIDSIFRSQDLVATNMARNLESLAGHYDQISSALHDKESGIEFSEDDFEEMNRDTDELPNIISELERDESSIRLSHDELRTRKDTLSEGLKNLRSVVGRLDGLSDAMEGMLEQLQNSESDFEMQLASLQSHLTTLEHLYLTYTSYQHSYNQLLLEMDRRRRCQEDSRRMAEEMARRLEEMREEEIQARASFNETHQHHLPEEFGFSILSLPTCWEIKHSEKEVEDVLPDIDEDLIIEAKKQADLAKAGSESL